MITIQTQSDGVLFNFQDSTRYLYGDGSILTPYNSLTLIADESNVLTFRKSASNDIFITAGYDELGYSSKEEAINDLKTKLFKATGGSESGITSGDVETMIDAALADYYTDDEVDAGFSAVTEEISAAVSGKADTSAVTAVENDVLVLQDALAGKANTAALTAHTADTGIHVSQQEKNAWNAKAEPYSAGTGIEISGNIISATGDYYEQVSGITIEYNSDSQTPEIMLQGEDDDQRNENVFNRWGIATSAEMEDGSSYSSGLGGGTIYNNASDYPDENVMSERSLEITTDGFRQTTYDYYDDGESGYTRYSSENEFNYSNGLTLSQQWYDRENDETTTSSIEINNNDGTSIHFTDGSDELDLNNQMFDWTDGTDSRSIRWGDIASLNDIPEYSAGTGIEISGNVISATGGGGATYSAGRNISIDTANTINCTLPISATGRYLGKSLILTNGNGMAAEGACSIIAGNQVNANQNASYGCAVGSWLNIKNESESSFGVGNNSVTGSTASGKTLFSVGNGTSSVRHNAFEIRQNGDIYITSGGTDIKLQDNLGGGGGGGSVTVDPTLDTGSTNPVANSAITAAVNDLDYRKADVSEMYYLLDGSIEEGISPIRFMRISQSDYDTLVENYETEPDVLYIITPDEENEGGNDWEE